MNASKPQYNFHFKEKFHEVLEKEKKFLDPNLTLVSLAEILDTNRTYISLYLNHVLNCSFYDYINKLRIQVALQLLDTTDDKVEFIALHSGFRSITTFRRIFMKYNGITASEYRNRKRMTAK